MLSLFFGAAAAHALIFDGGISLSQLPTPALLVDVDELPGGVEALPHAPRERREALRDALFVHARVVRRRRQPLRHRRASLDARRSPLAKSEQGSTRAEERLWPNSTSSSQATPIWPQD